MSDATDNRSVMRRLLAEKYRNNEDHANEYIETATRLDALCRSTLDPRNNKRTEFNNRLRHEFNSDVKSRDSVDARLHENNDVRRPRDDVRLPLPSYEEAKIESTRCLPEHLVAGIPVVSPRFRLNEHAQMNGHPKSNSTGEEYLYTDHVTTHNRRGGRRKNIPVRSNSLHQNKVSDRNVITEGLSLQNVSMKRTDSQTSVRSNGGDSSAYPSARHTASTSTPLQKTGKVDPQEQRRYSLHGYQGNTPSRNEDLSEASPMSQTTTTQSPYLRGVAPGYYTPMTPSGPQNPPSSPHMTSLNANSPHMTTINGQHMTSHGGNNSPPRPPPPPYPTGIIMQGATTPHEEGGWGHPARPNSLALGKLSKKKNSNGTGSTRNSPSVTSPTSSTSFASTPRGTPFYAGTPNTAQQYHSGNTQNHPHQRQTSGGSTIGGNTYLRRSQSGSSVRPPATTTPSYPPPFTPEPNMRNNYPQESYNINKSSSMTSSGSGGARGIARRRKRNNSSKGSYANTSGSGSSSNGGSRPNSTADLTERLVGENENCRERLQNALHKLQKFENIEIELQRIQEEHRALNVSANKRAQLESERVSQLNLTILSLTQDKEQLKDEVTRLNEKLETLNIVSTNQKEETIETRDSDVIKVYEYKNRKMAERQRQLEEELDEYKEQVSEQSQDIRALTSSLETAESTILSLKEKLVDSRKVDSNTTKLSDQLSSLLRIVEERENVEKQIQQNISGKTQRPLTSTSSNDEGISGMDTSDVTQESRDHMLKVKAEMLKWQHMYMEHTVLRHLQNNGNHPRLFKTINKHRHAVSDPGFNNSTTMSFDNVATMGFGSTRNINNELNNGNNNDLDNEFNNGINNRVNNGFEGPKIKDNFSQTPQSLNEIQETSEPKKMAEIDEKMAGANNMVDCGLQVGIDGDSPSEGYHSQQSSGSPTPNTEKSNNFPGDYPNLRRNQSADVLTSLDCN